MSILDFNGAAWGIPAGGFPDEYIPHFMWDPWTGEVLPTVNYPECLQEKP